MRLFRKDLVGSVEEVLKVAILGMRIPKPTNLELLRKTNEAIKFYPFLLDLSIVALMRHRMIVVVAVEYLKKMLGLMAARGFDRVKDFESFANLNGFL